MLAHAAKDRFIGVSSCNVAAVANGRLHASSHRELRWVDCEYRHGTLVLRGRLPSYFHKQLAQEAVGNLEGVEEVCNEIEVAGTR